MLIKQFSRHQARWSEFFFRFNYQIIYRFGKVNGKSDILTRRSGNLFKKKNKEDSRHLHQHQTVLKFHVLDSRIQEDLQESVFEFKIFNLQCKVVSLNSIQLHFFFISASPPISLRPMDMDLDIENSENLINDPEPQLDQEEFNAENDLINIFI